MTGKQITRESMGPVKKGTCIIVLLLVTLGLRGTVCAEAELLLIRDLMSRYDSDVRPSENLNEAVPVSIDITLHQIVEVDVKNQIITCSIWQRLYWKDDHLKWNASEYGNLTKIRLSSARVWRPDIALVNDVRGESQDSLLDYPATVRSDGSIRWLTPRLLQSSCILDMTYFPWDSQTCTLHFASWTHDDNELAFASVKSSADSIDYLENGEWELVGLPVRKYSSLAPCCDVPFTNVEFDIQLRRRARYYIANLIFPSALITTAGMLVFCLPLESGEKVSLSVTILLATTVYQLLLADRMPVQSTTTPLIGRFIMSTQILLGLSTTLTVLILNIHHQGVFGHSVPKVVKTVVNVLARIICLKGTAKNVWRQSESNLKNKRDEDQRKCNQNYEENGHENYSLMNNIETRNRHRDPESEGIRSSTLNDQRSASHSEPHQHDPVLHQSIQRIVHMMEDYQDTMNEKESNDDRMLEWMFVAKTLDRLFLILFGSCVFVSSLALLVGHPHYRSA